MNRIKRIFYFVLTSVVALIFSPLMIILTLLVRCMLGKPIIFKQQRPGLHAKPFYIYKFRTMNDKKNTHGEFLTDAERITTFGKYLRFIPQVRRKISDCVFLALMIIFWSFLRC